VTLLCLHAHPDDEAMLTGELLAKAGAAGMRTVVVYGTWGDAGETTHDLGGQTLGQRRSREARAACAELGVARVEGLEHLDSGMAGTATNANPAAFGNLATEAVVDQLVEVLGGEELVAVVGYDANGTYGHPDHLQVHRCAHALAVRLEVPWLIDATFNRDRLLALPPTGGHHDPALATPQAEITHFVQGHPWFRAKMQAIKQHGSQVRQGQPTMGGVPPRPRRTIDEWRARFGTEWFIVRSPAGATDLGPLAGVLEPIERWPGPLTRPSSQEQP
jgi:LmbE family N-acetylglucosaminyl deacetylase